QQMRVASRNATGLAIGSPAPLDLKRVQLPINEEQPIAPIYGYAFVSDAVEGLIVIDIRTLSDGIPTNNRIARSATFNPNGQLTAAPPITLAGDFAYIPTARGVVVVNVADPLQPRVAAEITAPLKAPRHVAVQFRYAFVTDADGLKVIDITFPERPRVVEGAA